MNKINVSLMLGVLAIMILELIGFVSAADLNCTSLYWFDNDNKSCGQKEFCGMYMYLGLQTFESKTQCEKVLNESVSCFKEGESPNLIYNNESCCAGLKHVQSLYRINTNQGEEECVDVNMTYSMCINCGDGSCNEAIENKCNCPQDCKNKTKECPNNSGDENGKCMFNLSNGRKAEIKIMPDTASQTAIARLGELNFTIQLKEVGAGDSAEVVYELTGKKQGKFLGIFKIMATERVQVDAETGEVKKAIKPWWSFLASKI
jgi:hypothetical protein